MNDKIVLPVQEIRTLGWNWELGGEIFSIDHLGGELSGVIFDLDAVGKSAKLSWFLNGKYDPILAFGLNGNGAIDGG